MTTETAAQSAYPFGYVHSANYFHSPDLNDYDAMSDAEFMASGCGNVGRAEVELRAIATERRSAPAAALPALIVRLEALAVHAAGFVEDDPEEAAQIITLHLGAATMTGTLVDCIDVLRNLLSPPVRAVAPRCPTCGRA